MKDLEDLDDIQAHLYEWLPTVSHYFPGITSLNVDALTLDWWRIYVDHARAIIDAKKAAASPSRPRR